MRGEQGVLFQSESIPKDMIKYVGAIPRESIVEVQAVVQRAAQPVESTSLRVVELGVQKLYTVNRAAGDLPFQLDDASRPEGAVAEDGSEYVKVHLDTRLDSRWIDLRTQTNQAIMRISSTVCALFREFLLKRDFVEIHTPKLLGGASEGGTEVFRFKYFGRDACLAQSPQLYKQMCAACSGFERVFEVGPVFRAENSHTHRHLCEFTGLDLEMAIKEHYYEVLDVFGELFVYIFDGLNERCKAEQAIIQKQYPFEPLKVSSARAPARSASLRLAGADSLPAARPAVSSTCAPVCASPSRRALRC